MAFNERDWAGVSQSGHDDPPDPDPWNDDDWLWETR